MRSRLARLADRAIQKAADGATWVLFVPVRRSQRNLRARIRAAAAYMDPAPDFGDADDPSP